MQREDMGWGHPRHEEHHEEYHGFNPGRHHHGPGHHGGPGPFGGGKGHHGPFGHGRGPHGHFGQWEVRPGPFGHGEGPRGPFGRGEGRRGHWWHGGGRPKVRRGNVRTAILALLSEGPANGYQLIQQIGERSGGVWEPSPGSIYPALQLLQDEGLVKAEESEGKRLFSLTDAGRAHAEEHRSELNAVWGAVAGTVDDSMVELRNLAQQVGIAVMQVAGTGTESQVAEARRLLAQVRRQLYGILAAEEPAEPSQPSGETQSL